MSRRLRGAVAALGVVAFAGLPTPAHAGEEPPPEIDADTVLLEACDQGVPEGWTVLEDASGLGLRNVVCNYRIERKLPGSDVVYLSGAAITIEYFCTVEEADEAYLGKTTRRDTQTTRTATKMIIEEGPLAANPDNPQREGVFSMFFPDLFTLMEKAWIRYNSHIVGTLVLLTNDRVPGGPPVEQRISINSVVEAVGRTVANTHLPTDDPSCFIPPLDGAGDVDAGGGSGPVKIAVASGIGVILVGGGVIWQRKRPRRIPTPQLPGGATSVPPRCADVDRRYHNSRETLLTLMEALEDVRERLQRAERIQHHNILRFNALAAIDAGRLIGGPLSAVDHIRGRILKPPPLQADTWKPPINLSPTMMARLDHLRGLADAAKKAAAAAQARLTEALRRVSAVATGSEVRAIRNSVAASRAALDGAKSNLRVSQLLRRDITAATREIGGELRKLADVVRPMADLEKEAGRLRKLIGLVDDADDIAELNADLQRTMSKLQPLQAQRAAIESSHADLVRRRIDLQSQLEAAGNVQRAHVEPMIAAHDRLVANAAATESRLLAEARGAHRAAQEEMRRAWNQQSMATSALAAAQRTIDVAGPLTGTSFGRRASAGVGKVVAGTVGWALSPLISAFEWGFGRNHSIPEAYEIIVRGQEFVTREAQRLALLEKAYRHQRSVAHRLRGDLARCIGDAPGRSANNANTKEVVE